MSEKNNVWGKAVAVPHIGNPGLNAAVISVSCGGVGNCSAGGYYTDQNSRSQAFVVNQANGAWGAAKRVVATLNKYEAEVLSVSCRSAGNCSAGGFYDDALGHQQAFVVSEKNGVWGSGTETASLNVGHSAETVSVSCGGAGNCVAGGYYLDASSSQQAFLVSETGNVWRNAFEVPGTAALNAGGEAEVSSVSCASVGNCSAVGNYLNGSGRVLPFVVTEKNGKWGNAVEVPGLAAINPDGTGQVNSVSCRATTASASNCSAGGYVGVHGNPRAFVVSEKNGVWGNAQALPAFPLLTHNAVVTSVSCASAGNCAAVGHYDNNGGTSQVFVVGENNWVWGKPAEVPGTAALNVGSGGAGVSAFCVSPHRCSLGGYYADAHGLQQAFVTSP